MAATRPARLESQALERYRPWFYTAALYNLAWGALNILLARQRST